MPPARPFSCQECSRAFTRSENLERHKRTHHDGPTAPRFECQLCHAKFARKDVCKRHNANCAARTAGNSTSAQVSPLAGSDSNPDNFAPDETSTGMDMSDSQPHMTQDISRHLENPTIGVPLVSVDTLLQNTSIDTTLVHIKSYIDYFHPSLPILHLPSLTLDKTPAILLKIVVAIGCIHSISKAELVSTNQDRQWSHDLWKSGCIELEAFVKSKYQRLRTTWVLQSWLLYIVYGNFSGDQRRIAKAREMYRFMTDAVRDFGLLHQKSVISKHSAWDYGIELSMSADGINRRWQSFISQEATKLLLYAFYFFDYHLFASCNIRPNISVIEFEWDLPLSRSLWEATSATTWWDAVLRREIALKDSSDNTISDESKAQTRSLLAACQALMSKTASPWLIKALEASPFASLCVVANLDSLVRDFTRCYYQLPPALADPSPFHVLTQQQNAQVATALTTMSSVIENCSCTSCNENCQSLWHAVLLGCLSIKISLCKPDDLLVGGIIELNPAAGLATSVHLSLGNYVSNRRSTLTSRRRLMADVGFITILDDMLKAVHLMGIIGKSPAWEGPWTTVQGLKILIILWQALRFSISELQSQVGDVPGPQFYTKIYEPARTAVHAIISALDIYDPEEQHVTHESLSTPEGLDNIDQLESELINWMKRVCDRRDVWDIGPSMSKVLDEVHAMDMEGISAVGALWSAVHMHFILRNSKSGGGEDVELHRIAR